MKTIISTWLLLCMACAGIAQTAYFNKIYYADTANILSVAGKSFENKHIISGDYNAPSNYSAFYCRIIDEYGNTSSFFDIDGSYNAGYRTILFGGSLSQTVDGNFILSGVVGADPTGIDRDFVVIKFDEFGYVIWKQLYEDSDELEGNAQILPVGNGNYLLYGWRYHVYSPDNYGFTKFYASKLDAMGNKIWEKTYGSNANTLYAEQTQDGGFILSGYKYSSATGYDMYAVKTDSLGNLQWQQTYGTEHNDNGGFVRELSNGHYILFGTISLDTELQDYYYIAELDENGTELWHQLHEFNQYCGNNTVPYLETANNSAIAIIYNYTATTMRVIEFCRFSTIDGSIITRAPISSGLPGEDYIRDIEPTPDGGYLLVGFNYTSPAKSWVLKVDSLGHTCGPAPCDSIAYPLQVTPPLNEGWQGREQPTRAEVYPNPAKGNTTITYSLPTQLPFGVVELYNLKGEKVRYWVLQPSFNPSQRYGITQALNLEGIPPGMYVWRLALPGGYEQYEASGKVVVE